MAKDLAGSITKVAINGVTYRVATDADLSRPGGKFKNEAMASSGGNFRKMTKQPEEVKSCVLLVNADEAATLKALNDGIVNVTLSYTNAAGDSFKAASGWINFDTWTTQDSKATLSMFPSDTWESFVNA
jgi:hypothetical protein